MPMDAEDMFNTWQMKKVHQGPKIFESQAFAAKIALDVYSDRTLKALKFFAVGFRVVINTNEPGTAPSLTGSAITKPVETKDELGDEALLQKLDAKHEEDVSGNARIDSPQEEPYESINHYPRDEADQYQTHSTALEAAYQPSFSKGESFSSFFTSLSSRYSIMYPAIILAFRNTHGGLSSHDEVCSLESGCPISYRV